MHLSHSYKGTTWKDHKYIKKEDGRYYYTTKTKYTSGGGEIVETPNDDEDYLNSKNYVKSKDEYGNTIWVPDGTRVRDNVSMSDYIADLIRDARDNIVNGISDALISKSKNKVDKAILSIDEDTKRRKA